MFSEHKRFRGFDARVVTSDISIQLRGGACETSESDIALSFSTHSCVDLTQSVISVWIC